MNTYCHRTKQIQKSRSFKCLGGNLPGYSEVWEILLQVLDNKVMHFNLIFERLLGQTRKWAMKWYY